MQIPDTVPVEITTQHIIKSILTEYYQLINTSPDFLSFALKRFVYLFGITLAIALFPLYFMRDLNASDTWIGLLYTAQTAVLVVGYFFWPRQSRRKGSRFIMLFTTFCVALYPRLVALTTN
jgi:MFS family permease